MLKIWLSRETRRSFMVETHAHPLPTKREFRAKSQTTDGHRSTQINHATQSIAKKSVFICVHPWLKNSAHPLPAARCPPNANSKRKHKPQINTHKSCDSIPRKTSVFIRVHPWLKNSAHPPDASHQTRILSGSTNHRSTPTHTDKSCDSIHRKIISVHPWLKKAGPSWPNKTVPACQTSRTGVLHRSFFSGPYDASPRAPAPPPTVTSTQFSGVSLCHAF